MSIIDELGFYDKELIDERKKMKSLCTLKEYLMPISMVWNVTQMSFNDVADAINTEIERQKRAKHPIPTKEFTIKSKL